MRLGLVGKLVRGRVLKKWLGDVCACTCSVNRMHMSSSKQCEQMVGVGTDLLSFLLLIPHLLSVVAFTKALMCGYM